MMARYMLALILFAHIALVFMHFGGGVLDTLIFFPNWFHNLPDSLTTAKQFNQYRNPGMFFLPMTGFVVLSGAIFVVAAWKREPASKWVLVDVVLFILVLLMTGAFIYPRIGQAIGDDPLTLEAMQQIATEMNILTVVRVFIVAAAALFAAFALWRFMANTPKMHEPVAVEPAKTVEEE